MGSPTIPPMLAELQDHLQTLVGEDPATFDTGAEAVALAERLLSAALAQKSRAEASEELRLGRLMEDKPGRLFTTAFTDQALRAIRLERVAEQLRYLLRATGVPTYFGWFDRLQLRGFQALGRTFPKLLVPRVLERLKKEVRRVALPSEPDALSEALAQRKALGFRVNMNHLGEAILGEDEARARHAAYLTTLERPDIDAISVKISAITSQIDTLAWERTLGSGPNSAGLAERVAQLYAKSLANGNKWVMLDMEEYRDLHLTVELFKRTVSRPEFKDARTGLVLQAYLPDSHAAQKDLVEFATARVRNGGAPIRLRLVKGANLAMERVDAALHGWPQAPYRTKAEVDSNFKRMVEYGLRPEHAAVAHVGIGSHNLFDIAWAMVLRATRGVEPESGFEMLEGIAAPLARVVAALTGDLMIYAPTADDEDLLSAIAYLIRRLDENTGPDNFLRHQFGMVVGSEAWNLEKARFLRSLDERDVPMVGPRRTQDRGREPQRPDPTQRFENEPDTDFALPQNRHWIEARLAERRFARPGRIPLVVDGESITSRVEVPGTDPSRPGEVLYQTSQADLVMVDRALTAARKALGEPVAWAERARWLLEVAHRLRVARGALIATMVADAGKAVPEADAEVSEAIDFAEYYRRSLAQTMSLQQQGQVTLRPRGVAVVTPPWNFPLAIPAGGVLAALAAGNAVILKPAPETVGVAFALCELIWDAGVPRSLLQFLPCPNDPVGTALVSDPRVDVIILTGSTATAKRFLSLRPELFLVAETGGKNATVVTEMADHDLAVKHVLHSAFSHAGQKCSATSLLILEAALYDDLAFRRRLKDAVLSLPVGSAWELGARVTPLIREPQGDLAWALLELDPGEEWLVAPRRDAQNPRLVHPGVKLGVQPGSRTHQRELFGPVLGVMRAADLDDALALANGTPYGLTAGLESLDAREIETWVAHMDAGCLYVNRATTGAIVRRQPFGGRKASVFGPGAKAGGPNYVLQLMRARDVEGAAGDAPKTDYAATMREQFADSQDPRASSARTTSSATRRCAAACCCASAPGPRPSTRGAPSRRRAWPVRPTRPCASRRRRARLGHADLGLPVVVESAATLAARLPALGLRRLRALGELERDVLIACRAAHVHPDAEPVVSAGRVELLRYLEEQTLSLDYHRFGNLGARDGEPRAPVT
ncbi:MAG: proline dehydrogenase family protein [Myxococcota bacterium]